MSKYLNLLLCSGCDVGDGPARLLLDALLWAGLQKMCQERECVAMDDDLGLIIVSCDDVADSPQGRDQNGGLRVPTSKTGFQPQGPGCCEGESAEVGQSFLERIICITLSTETSLIQREHAR